MVAPKTERYLVDTNLIVRLVTGTPAGAARAVESLFEQAATRRLTLWIEPLVLAEAFYVLTSFYKVSREAAIDAIGRVIALQGVYVPEAQVLGRAFEICVAQRQLHLVDCYLIAKAEAAQAGIATFDVAIGKYSDVPVLDPSKMT